MACPIPALARRAPVDAQHARGRLLSEQMSPGESGPGSLAPIAGRAA